MLCLGFISNVYTGFISNVNTGFISNAYTGFIVMMVKYKIFERVLHNLGLFCEASLIIMAAHKIVLFV